MKIYRDVEGDTEIMRFGDGNLDTESRMGIESCRWRCGNGVAWTLVSTFFSVLSNSSRSTERFAYNVKPRTLLCISNNFVYREFEPHNSLPLSSFLSSDRKPFMENLMKKTLVSPRSTRKNFKNIDRRFSTICDCCSPAHHFVFFRITRTKNFKTIEATYFVKSTVFSAFIRAEWHKDNLIEFIISFYS
jgi:hypothetical protein